MSLGAFVLGFLAYILASRLALRRLGGTCREIAFTVLNVVGLYWFVLFRQNDHYNTAFAIYLAVVVAQFAALRLFSERKGWTAWLAFFTPIAILAVARYAPLCLSPALQATLRKKLELPPAAYLVGLSYLAFRSSHLVLEIRNGVVKRPGFWEYLGFCFFVPTMPVGPINPYSHFRLGFEPKTEPVPVGRAALRILVGVVKFQFFGVIFNRLTFEGFMLNEHPHPWMDLPVAIVFYYLFLYCNFSGFCDAAIGAAGLIGIPVPENFNNPFGARNVKEFWNRWHITLSTYMRDVVFSPLSRWLVHRMGVPMANHAIALTITAVFLLVGIWHGVGWNFAAYGAVHALGVVGNHYYTIFLKKRLGRDRFKAYNDNRWIQACAVCLTFCYCGASLLFFANTFPQLRELLSNLR